MIQEEGPLLCPSLRLDSRQVRREGAPGQSTPAPAALLGLHFKVALKANHTFFLKELFCLVVLKDNLLR